MCHRNEGEKQKKGHQKGDSQSVSRLSFVRLIAPRVEKNEDKH